MKEFISSVKESTKKFSLLDFSLLKIGLIAIGILLGIYFAEFFLRYINIIWVIAGISYLWIMYVTLVSYRK